jgi:cytochrome c oxidase subunit 1
VSPAPQSHTAPSASGRTGIPEVPGIQGELWIFTQDHRRLGWMYAILIGLGMVIGTLLALGLSLQSLAGRGAGLASEDYRRLFTVHGLAMVFAVALPALGGTLGNWLLPRRLCVEEMAWPRLNLLAFHLLVASWLLFLVAFLVTPPDAGWNFELTLSLRPGSAVAWSMLGAICAVTSVAISGANAAATLVKSRQGGAPWSEVPFLGWALAVAGVMQALAAPWLVISLAMLFAQKNGASDVLSAGALTPPDVRLDAWFWMWAQPALAGTLLAAVGVVGDVFESRGDGRIEPGPASLASVLALLAVAVTSFASAGVHTAGRGGAPGLDAASSAMALCMGIPLAVFVTQWMLALGRGPVTVSASLCFAIASAVSLVSGAMATAFLVALPTGEHLANTSFAPAAGHVLAVGGLLGALFAGGYGTWSSWFGGLSREGTGRFAGILLLAGTLLCFVPPCVRGFLGDPRRVVDLAEGRALLSWTSVTGAGLIVSALSLAAWGLLAPLLDARASLDGGERR